MIVVKKNDNMYNKDGSFTLTETFFDYSNITKEDMEKAIAHEHQKIAINHGVLLDQIDKELSKGIKTEIKHTKNKINAYKIAINNIKKNVDYYSNTRKTRIIVKSIQSSSSVECQKLVKKDVGLVEKAIKTPAQKKFDLVMHEFEVGALTDSHGNLVTDKDQALAIAYSESGMSKSQTIVKSIIVKARDYKDKLQRLIVRRQKIITSPPAEYDHKYKLQDRMSWHGLNIAIENKKGSYRTGKDPDGKPWKTYMNFDYGRIGGTKGIDSEGIDIYLGPDDTAEMVYVVHQQDPFKKCYDEDKALIQFVSKESAIEGYLSQYDRPDFLGPVSEFTIPEFKIALKERRGTMLYNSPNQFRKSRIIVRDMRKAKRMAIGTVSHGRKKVAEGKWVPVKSGGAKKTKAIDKEKKLKSKLLSKLTDAGMNTNDAEKEIKAITKNVDISYMQEYLGMTIESIFDDIKSKKPSLFHKKDNPQRGENKQKIIVKPSSESKNKEKMEYTYHDKKYGEDIKIIFRPNTNFALVPSYGSGKAYSTHKNMEQMKSKINRLYTDHLSFEVIDRKGKVHLASKEVV